MKHVRLKQYNNLVAKKYIFLLSEEIKSLPEGKYFVSRKLDGQLWFYLKENKQSHFVNSNNKEIGGIVKHIIKDLDKKFKKYPEIIVAGELYSQINQRERCGDVISALSDKNKLEDLHFGIFDIIHGDKFSGEFSKRYEELIKVAASDKKSPAHVIEHKQVNKKDIQKYFKDKIETNDAEGLIVRNDSKIYKIKKEETLDAVITGYTTAENNTEVRSVSLGVFVQPNEILHIGSCGGFSSGINKKELFKDLKKLSVKSNFHKVGSNGSAYTFVEPKIVVEVNVLDLQTDKSDDSPIRHVKFELEKNKLNVSGKMRSVSILNAQIINIRIDKKADIKDVGLSQITNITGLSKKDFEQNLVGKKLPNSKILKKDVFKKKSKKGTAVRKFLFWKTNKDENLEYPAYLCYYLDYSEGRKDPIKKRLYPFNEEKIGLNFFKKILEDNIKKGWEKA